MTDDETKAGGVESRNVGDVEDVEGRTLFACWWFEFENVDDCKGLEDAVHLVCSEGS